MSTRATIRFATREDGVTFSEHPKKWNAQFYRHTDGYPEGLGLDIAHSIVKSGSKYGVDMEIEHVDVVHGDIEYMYYIWQDHSKEIWISIFEIGWGHMCKECGQEMPNRPSECIFVGTPKKLIEKYKQNTNDDG